VRNREDLDTINNIETILNNDRSLESDTKIIYEIDKRGGPDGGFVPIGGFPSAPRSACFRAMRKNKIDSYRLYADLLEAIFECNY